MDYYDTPQRSRKQLTFAVSLHKSGELAFRENDGLHHRDINGKLVHYDGTVITHSVICSLCIISSNQSVPITVKRRHAAARFHHGEFEIWVTDPLNSVTESRGAYGVTRPLQYLAAGNYGTSDLLSAFVRPL